MQVGDSGVGKTSLIKLLAKLTGRRLHTFTVNSDMDVTELLGGFQQVVFFWKFCTSTVSFFFYST